MFETFILTVNYVTSADFFYQAMGITTATSIFIGAAVYNGEVKNMFKGIITIGTYAVMIFLTNLPRIIETIDHRTLTDRQTSMAYASTVTILFITFYYILGMIIGVYTVRKATGKGHKK